MYINEQNIIPRISLRRHLIAFVIVLVVGCFATSNAQWTTPDGNGNINNTNSGNVGIGTSPGTGNSLDVAGNVLNLGSETGTKNRGNNTTKLSRLAMPPYVTANMRFALLGGATTSTANIVALGGEVGGMSAATQIDFFTAATTNVDTGTLRMTINGSGNVGIGSSAPDTKFQVFHTSTNTNLANIQLADLGFVIRNTSNTNGNMSLISFQDSTGYGNAQIGTIQKDQTNHSGDMVFFTRESTSVFGERMRIASTGKIGVGTAAPTALFHIMTSDGENLRLHRNVNTNGWGVAEYFTLNNSSGAGVDYGQISGGITSNTAGAETGVLAFYTRNSGTLGERLRIHGNGNITIGTTNAVSYKLHVEGGSINATDGLCINGDCRATWASVTGPWTSGSGSINYSAGSVGIGTNSPLYTLDVNGGVNGFRAKAASAASGDTIATFENNSAIKMIVRADGKVGIGNSSPQKTLDVNGDINAVGTITGGTIQAKYQDVAEWVDSSQQLTAGTVVILDPDKNNQVVASTQSYDTRVAGVISPQPGITLGERGEGRVLVAASGRVRVKVDASNGPIKIGDLLVTSDKEGFAMKSLSVEFGGVRMHRPGTLIGKALEPLAQGSGEILVLLSLQ
ncbi:MAG TPA: hypothetical protein VN724_05025 [Pyrinomonadaceae bacterium]|nr:hypothetical protein [Pyrinomonadaceae bacterium]